MPLEIGALDSRLLRLRHVQHQAASDDYNRQYAFALHHRLLLRQFSASLQGAGNGNLRGRPFRQLFYVIRAQPPIQSDL